MEAMPSNSPESPVLRAVRRLLLLILAIGMLGTATDLVLIEHYEEAWQLSPLALIGVALIIVAILWFRATPAGVTALRIAMVLFIASGALGVLLHYNGNREFQTELDPSLTGWALFAKVVTAKAPPAMAPGAMVQLGLIGLLFTYRHPALSRPLTPDEPHHSQGA
jgi:hypothetical protein